MKGMVGLLWDDRYLLHETEPLHPELILVSAGFDPHQLDPLGGMYLSDEGFSRLADLVLGLSEELCVEGRSWSWKGDTILRPFAGLPLRSSTDSPIPEQWTARPSDDGRTRICTRSSGSSKRRRGICPPIGVPDSI